MFPKILQSCIFFHHHVRNHARNKFCRKCENATERNQLPLHITAKGIGQVFSIHYIVLFSFNSSDADVDFFLPGKGGSKFSH